MNSDELNQQVDAAFAVESQTSAPLKALILKVGEEHAKLVWSLGYLTGHRSGLNRAHELFKRLAA
jgi:hypothetical protein